MQLRIAGMAIALLLCTVLSAGGGKAAYRNYFMGSYYFNEGDYGRSLGYLQRAYDADPQEYNFALALALALGRNGKAEEGISLLAQSDYLLTHQHPEYRQLRAMRHFVAGLVFTFGEKFSQAIAALESAVAEERRLQRPETLGAMLNALGYARLLDQGRGSSATKHDTLGMHYHVHQRDLERCRETFFQALQADPQQPAAIYNYLLLCDTLGLTPAIENLQAVNRRGSAKFVTSRQSTLAVDMRPVLPFGDYDEVVFLLDISGSMVMEQVACAGDDRFKVMKQTALFLLDNLADSTACGIGTIGGDCGTVPKLWHGSGALSHRELRSELEFLYPDGTTPLLTILQQTPDLFSNRPGVRKSIFFISDGENICRQPGVDICEWSESLSAQGITINILTFLGASLDNTGAFAEYTCLAENTNGRILYLDVDRCQLERYTFDLAAACQLYIPELKRVSCWGPAVKNLWAVFPEK